ncbi:hypothetical protein NEFER03_1071 [Nematocida sp. LUAm3]|nr:hypothetical protein NEFER03_1071 [Nematocida sp. LUAm3]KAI5175324.1 hypothetical protein NEFER02_1253 [Nematocida sp. LUAm2]KAI5177719.1 hypothetical protein NEFER01_0943 [Nematocida sp. LUAm1]
MQKSKEKTSENEEKENTQIPNAPKLQKEEQIAAEAMVSFCEDKNKLMRKNQNKLAAKKFREKRTQYIEELQTRLYNASMQTALLQKKINFSISILENIVDELDRSVSTNSLSVRRIVEILLSSNDLFINNERYLYILHRLSSLLQIKKKDKY